MAIGPFHSLLLTSATTPALTTAYAVRPVYSDDALDTVANQGIGRAATSTIFVKCVRAAGAFTGATVKVQVSYDGLTSTTAAAVNWLDVFTTDLSSGAVTVEHTVSPGGSATAWLALGTESTRNAPFVRVLGKATGGAAGAGDSLDAWAVVS